MELRTRLAAACREVAAHGLVPGTAGNLSVRDGDRIAVTASGLVLADAEPEQITVVDRAGQVLEGTLRPTSELALHLAVYAAYDTGAIVHTHAPVGTALSCVLDELPPVHYQTLSFGGVVRVAPYATFGTAQLAENVVVALAGRQAALLANHGAVTHAATLPEAVQLAVQLEWLCTVYAQAAAVGTPRLLTPEQLADVQQQIDTLRYGRTQPLPGS